MCFSLEKNVYELVPTTPRMLLHFSTPLPFHLLQRIRKITQKLLVQARPALNYKILEESMADTLLDYDQTLLNKYVFTIGNVI